MDDAAVVANSSKYRSCEPAIWFNNAIVCEIPDSYATAALGLKGEVSYKDYFSSCFGFSGMRSHKVFTHSVVV